MPRRTLTINKMQNSTKLESWRLGTKCRHNADHLDQQHSSFNESTQLTLLDFTLLCILCTIFKVLPNDENIYDIFAVFNRMP